MDNCGTKSFLAPEILRRTGYDRSIDMWSAGVVYYYMLCGKLPFYNPDKMALYEDIKNSRFQDNGIDLDLQNE